MKVLAPGTVVLPSSRWRSELADELQSLGIAPEAADAAAVRVLRAVLDRAGWPGEVYEVASRPPDWTLPGGES